jgi:hypothetical protein
MAQHTNLDPRLSLPLSATFSGASGSGKTRLAQYILLHQRQLLTEPWTRIYWLAKYPQPELETALAGLPIEFLHVDTIPRLDELTTVPGDRTLITVDDLMNCAGGDEQISNLFTAGRHLGMSVFYMTQNLFCAGRYARNIRLNTMYLFLFKSLHDRAQISIYFRQMSPGNWRLIQQAYEDATGAHPYGYFMVDFRATSDRLLRFRSQLLADRQTLYDISLA